MCVVEPNTGNIMNHAVAGPQGEFIFGLFGPQLCSANATQGLYQYRKYKNHSIVKPLLTDRKITSGVAIDEECNVLYHLDGCLQELTAYDYNSGSLCKMWCIFWVEYVASLLYNCTALEILFLWLKMIWGEFN